MGSCCRNTYFELEERNTHRNSHINRIHRHCHQMTVSLELSSRQMVLFVQLNTKTVTLQGIEGIERF